MPLSFYLRETFSTARQRPKRAVLCKIYKLQLFFVDLLCNMPKIKNPENILIFLLTNRSVCVIIYTERNQER